MKPNIPLLQKVLSLPTAPFHEEKVAAFVLGFCKRLRLKPKQDKYGNIKVHYQRGNVKPIVFSAHMDHPGFEVIQTGKRTIVRLLGGVPDLYFLKARVVLWNQNHFVKGRVAKVFNKKKRQFLIQTAKRIKNRSFGYFDLPPFLLKKKEIHTKAADDIANVAILLNLFQVLVRQKAKANVICLFTRAEEVGFLGCLGAVREKFISKRFPIIVLEASSAKAGKADIGGGPVLRVGDKASTFSREIDLWLQQSASKLSQKTKGFQFQRALLSGGRCEATVFTDKGYLAGCLALPLGNYHNEGKKTYACEYIHLKDYANLLTWIVELSKSSPPRKTFQNQLKDIDLVFKRHAHRLKNIAG